MSGAQSIRDRLKAQVAEDVEDLELAVLPSFYEGSLVATYRPASEKELQKISELIQADRVSDANYLMLETCSGMWERQEDGKLQEIRDESGTHATWDAALAWYLGLEVGTNRELIDQVMKTKAAFLGHAGEVLTWNRDPSGTNAGVVLGG